MLRQSAQNIREHGLQIQEEWSYVDRDSGQVRQLDALVSCDLTNRDANRAMAGAPSRASGYLRASLDLLIECKQSTFPYIFFTRDSVYCEAPRVAGFPHDAVSIFLGGEDATPVAMSYRDYLGIYEVALARAPVYALTMARLERKGSRLEISGEDVFRGISLPLRKAVAHFEKETAPAPHHLFYDIRTVLPVAVVRAPLVAVRQNESGSPKLEYPAWVRVVQSEISSPGLGRGPFVQAGFFDVVHINHFGAYLDEAFECAREVGARAAEAAIPIITGKAIMREPDSDGPVDGADLAAYRTMPGLMDESAFRKWMGTRWVEVHSQLANNGGPASTTPE
ncbi:hypothetical protein [Luteipulveratus flavus]|uniref:Uncharacterized protein n=1 Tax=Luteipulveratus flavus TaxID=3031728 RepID=A0ABT6C6T8_9MICO|nr:hypothetical protein [Luteipulveratus sp. YIM 133296]MDF8264607.1 hypothetical protein [Luteipulveratus sp. YIM 133296]